LAYQEFIQVEDLLVKAKVVAILQRELQAFLVQDEQLGHLP
jgi:hypothetical protein